MTVIHSQFIDLATGLPRPGIYVYAKLVAPASWVADHQSQVIGTYEATSGADGWYSLTLPPQSSYEVSGTYYAVEEWGNTTWTVSVPDSDVPVLLRGCLVDPPPETNPFAPISTFDTLRDVDPSNRVTGDTVIVGDDGKLHFAAPVTSDHVSSKIAVLAASSRWTLDHNLGYDPAGIRLFDSQGEEFEAEISYPIPGSRVLVTFPFGVSVSGTAYLS